MNHFSTLVSELYSVMLCLWNNSFRRVWRAVWMLYDFKGKKKVSIVCANSETSALPFVHKLHGTSQNSVLARDQFQMIWPYEICKGVGWRQGSWKELNFEILIRKKSLKSQLKIKIIIPVYLEKIITSEHWRIKIRQQYCYLGTDNNKNNAVYLNII